MATLERTRLTRPIEDFGLRSELQKMVGTINRLIDAVNELATDKESVAGVSYVNTLGAAIPAGTLISYQSGTLALADASAVGTKAFLAVRNHVPKNAQFRGIVLDGDIYLRTEGNDDIVKGDPLFLSTTAGVVTKTAPTSPSVVQPIGFATGKEDLDIADRVRACISISPFAASP